MTDKITNEERLAILAGARAIGFEYHSDNTGKLVCTLDQLVQFSAEVANATANQIMEAFGAVK